jgi:hypothetical protein
MTIALAQSTSAVDAGTYGASVAATFGSTPAVNSLITVTGFMSNGDAATIEVEDNQTPSNAYTVVKNSGAYPHNCFVAYAIATASTGTFTATVSWTGGTKDATIQAQEWSGAATSSVLDVSANPDRTVGTTTASVTTTAAGDLLISAFADNGTSAITSTGPAGYAQSWFKNQADGGGSAAYKIAGAAGSESVTWPDYSGSLHWTSAVLVALKAAAGTASDPAASSSRFTTSRHTFGTRR